MSAIAFGATFALLVAMALVIFESLKSIVIEYGSWQVGRFISWGFSERVTESTSNCFTLDYCESSQCSVSSLCLSRKWCGLSSRHISFISFLLSSITFLSSASQPSFLFSSAAGFPYLSSRLVLLPFASLVSTIAVLAPGTRILALGSNVAGEPWHERIILSKACGSHFSMASPDLDIYSECVGGTPDFLQYYLVPADGSRPRGMMAGAAVYGFTDFIDFSGAPGAQLIREGIADAQAYRGVHRPDLGADGFEVLDLQFVLRPVLLTCLARLELFQLLRLFRLPPALQFQEWQAGFQRV